MSKNNLSYACESFVIECYKIHSALKGKKLFHFDEDRPAEVDCVVVQAVQGNHRLDGPKGYDVEITATYRAPAKVTVDRLNLVDSAMADAVFGARPGRVPSEKLFSYLLILDEMNGSNENSQNLRKREKKFQLIAKLQTQAENALSR